MKIINFDYLVYLIRQKRPSVEIWSVIKLLHTCIHNKLKSHVFVFFFIFVIMPRVLINICSNEELMSLPGIGAKGVDKILELREAKGDLELDDLNQVPYLRITQQLIDCLDFTSFDNKEGVGSLNDRHRERVRSVDKLIGKWDGTGQGLAKGRGKDSGSFDSLINRGKILS